jgi:hypothetical protein
MNPNLTVYYSATLENQRRWERSVKRERNAEAAVQSGGGCKFEFASGLKRVVAAAFTRPRQLVRGEITSRVAA